jgi:hypothetical protein
MQLNYHSLLGISGAIFGRKEDFSIKNLTDLMGKEVMVIQGDTAQEYVVREKLTTRLSPRCPIKRPLSSCLPESTMR